MPVDASFGGGGGEGRGGLKTHVSCIGLLN